MPCGRDALVRRGVNPGLDVWCRDWRKCRRRGLVQCKRVVRDAPRRVTRDVLIDRELVGMAMRAFALDPDVLGLVVSYLYIVMMVVDVEQIAVDVVAELEVLVRDRQGCQVGVVANMMIVMFVGDSIMRMPVGVRLRLVVGRMQDDRAIGRVRVIVVVRRQMEVGQNFDAEQPQDGCGHRYKAAPGGTSSPHRRIYDHIRTSDRGCLGMFRAE